MLLSLAWPWARLRTYKVRKPGPSLTSSLGLRPKRTESYNVELPSAMRSHGEEPRLQDQKTSQRKRQVGWAGKELLWTGTRTGQAGLPLPGSKAEQAARSLWDGLIRHSSLHPATDNQPHQDTGIHPAWLTLQNNSGPPLLATCSMVIFLHSDFIFAILVFHLKRIESKTQNNSLY